MLSSTFCHVNSDRFWCFSQILLFYLIFPLVIPAQVHTHHCISFFFFFFLCKKLIISIPEKLCSSRVPSWGFLHIRTMCWLNLAYSGSYLHLKYHFKRHEHMYRGAVNFCCVLPGVKGSSQQKCHPQSRFSKANNTSECSALGYTIWNASGNTCCSDCAHFQPSEKSMNFQSVLSQVLKMNNYYFNFFSIRCMFVCLS